MTAPDAKTVREIARRSLLNDIHRLMPSWFIQGVGSVIQAEAGPGVTVETFTAWHEAVVKEVAAAQIAVSWPDEQQPADGDPCAVCYCRGCPQCVNPTPPSEICFCPKAMRPHEPADVVTAEQQQDGAVEAVRNFAEVWRASDEWRRALDAGITDSTFFAVRGVRLTEPQLTAVLAERTALAARVAELESEREADTRAVVRVKAADTIDFSEGAFEEWSAANGALYDRFADRIEALVAGFGPACCVCGRILGYRNYRDQLFCWPCADGEPKTTDAAPDGLSKPVERPETPGEHWEGSNSSAGTAGLSEACGNKYDYHVCFLPAGHDGDHRDSLNWTWMTHLGTWPNDDDTTEDSQHG